MNYWLMKSEPLAYSIDDLKNDGVTPWDGVRNYQARNFMRDEMKKGDLVLFYHSNAKPPGIAGIGKIASDPYPDFTAFDPKSKYFDPKSKKENPTWILVDVSFVEKFPSLIPLDVIKNNDNFSDMLLIKKGMRLSIQPVSKENFMMIKKLKI